MEQRNTSLTDILPVVTLVIVVVVFSIISGGRILAPGNLSAVLDQSFTVMIGGMGMIFVLCHGGIDLSIGSLACMSVYLSGAYLLDKGIVPTLFGAILIGALVGLLTGTVVSRFKVPSFMVTVALQTGLRGICNYLAMTKGVLIANAQVQMFNRLQVKIPVILILLAISWYVFEYTRLGKYSKAIGENELCSSISGINVPLIKTVDFMISGGICGVTGLFMMARTGGVSNMLGKGFEMRVILALLLGSVPVVGGMDSKMFKVVIGALTVLMLENGLSVSGITGGLYQLIEGIMLVTVCVLTSFVKKRSALRDEKLMLQVKQLEEG